MYLYWECNRFINDRLFETRLLNVLCLVIECVPPRMDHMIYTPRQALPGATINITCEVGFTLWGEDKLNCDSEGNIIEYLPSCKCKYYGHMCVKHKKIDKIVMVLINTDQSHRNKHQIYIYIKC